MQLTGEARAARPDSTVRLSSFTRTLLTLCVCTAPVIGGVLPEDRADVMYHYYNRSEERRVGKECA